MADVESKTEDTFDRSLLEGRLKTLAKQGKQERRNIALFSIRIALRVFPIVLDTRLVGSLQGRLLLASWRAISGAAYAAYAAAYAGAASAANASAAAYAASAANAASAADAAYAAASAAYAAASVNAKAASAADAAYAAATAASAATAADRLKNNEFKSALLVAFEADLQAIEQGNRLTRDLWPEQVPAEFELVLERLFQYLRETDFAGIAEDYQDVLNHGVQILEKQPKDKYQRQWDEIQRRLEQEQPVTKESAETDSENISNTQEQTFTQQVAPQTMDRYSAPNRILGEFAANTDHLDREGLAKSLALWLQNKPNHRHLTIGLFGDWGVGKSTFINLIRPYLGVPRPDQEIKEADKNNPREIDFLYGEFNAWSYEHSGNIQAGLAQEAVTALTQGLNWCQRASLTWRFAWLERRTYLSLVILTAVFLLPISVATALKNWSNLSEIWVALVTFFSAIALLVQQGRKIFAHPMATELKTYLRLPDFGEHLGTVPVMTKQLRQLAELRLKSDEGKTRLLFVIDDLDRCSPEGVLKTFEAVRLVMDIPQVSVVIAIDKRVALSALALHYEKLERHRVHSAHFIAREYLAKVIHVAITLERPSEDQVNTYLEKHLWEDDKSDNVAEENDMEPQQPGTKLSENYDMEDELAETENPQIKPDIDSGDSSNNGSAQGNSLEEFSQEPEKNHLSELGTSAKEEESTAVKENTEEEIREIVGRSPEQRDEFKKWVRVFKITNPRQLKRLDNAYQLIRLLYPDENRHPSLSRLKMLLWLEYFNELPEQRRRQLRQYIRGDEGAQVNEDEKKHWQEISAQIGSPEAIESTYRQVKAFVLPAIELDEQLMSLDRQKEGHKKEGHKQDEDKPV